MSLFCAIRRHRFGPWRAAKLGWDEHTIPWFSVRHCQRCSRLDIGGLLLSQHPRDKEPAH